MSEIILICPAPEEREFYSSDVNVIDWCGKSSELVFEIQERYSFVGCAFEEYVAYFGRENLPDDMWSFTSEQGVKAGAGFSVVPKKNGVGQRKLLM